MRPRAWQRANAETVASQGIKVGVKARGRVPRFVAYATQRHPISVPLPASRRHLMALGRPPVRKAPMRWRPYEAGDGESSPYDQPGEACILG
jgi:hypothetical protein